MLRPKIQDTTGYKQTCAVEQAVLCIWPVHEAEHVLCGFKVLLHHVVDVPLQASHCLVFQVSMNPVRLYPAVLCILGLTNHTGLAKCTVMMLFSSVKLQEHKCRAVSRRMDMSKPDIFFLPNWQPESISVSEAKTPDCTTLPWQGNKRGRTQWKFKHVQKKSKQTYPIARNCPKSTYAVLETQHMPAACTSAHMYRNMKTVSKFWPVELSLVSPDDTRATWSTPILSASSVARVYSSWTKRTVAYTDQSRSDIRTASKC